MSTIRSKCADSAELPDIHTADYFTACRGRGTRRTRDRFLTMEEAEAYAEAVGDGRTMIYAVSNYGRCIHIKNH